MRLYNKQYIIALILCIHSSYSLADITAQGPIDAHIRCDEQKNRCVAIEKKDPNCHICYYKAYFSNDYMKTWEKSNIENNRDHYYYWFTDLACGKNLNNCIAVGHQELYDRSPYSISQALLLVSKDGGKNWSGGGRVEVCGNASKDFKSIVCDETGLICKAQGSCYFSFGEYKNFEASTQDGGNVWQARICPNKQC